MSGKSSLTPRSQRDKSLKRLFLDWASFLGFVGLAVYTSNTHREAHRVPASKSAHMLSPAEIAKNPGQLLRMTKKLTNPLSVEVRMTGKSKKIIAGQPFTLAGRVKTSNPFSNLDLQWKLPEGVRIVSGPIKTHFISIEAGDTKEIEVTLISDADNNQQVHLVAGARRGNLKYSNVAQYNTVLEEELTEQKADLVKRSKAYMEKQTH